MSELATLRHLAQRHIGVTQEQRKAVEWALGMIGAGETVQPEVRTTLPHQLGDIFAAMVEEELIRCGFTRDDLNVRMSNRRGAVGRGLLARGLTVAQAAKAMGSTYGAAKSWSQHRDRERSRTTHKAGARSPGEAGGGKEPH